MWLYAMSYRRQNRLVKELRKTNRKPGNTWQNKDLHPLLKSALLNSQSASCKWAEMGTENKQEPGGSRLLFWFLPLQKGHAKAKGETSQACGHWKASGFWEGMLTAGLWCAESGMLQNKPKCLGLSHYHLIIFRLSKMSPPAFADQ